MTPQDIGMLRKSKLSMGHLFMNIILRNSKFIYMNVWSNSVLACIFLFFFSSAEDEIDAHVAERRGKFYSIPLFRRHRIQANLNSTRVSRGKPEGPNIILGTRGSRYAWVLTRIHFPNRRVNVKNTARVFSRRGGTEKIWPWRKCHRGSCLEI